MVRTESITSRSAKTRRKLSTETPLSARKLTSFPKYSPVSDFNADDETLKDVYFPDDPCGEILLEARIRSAFETAGYRIRQAGKAETHPVFIVHLIRTTAEHIPEHDRLFQHVRQLLHQKCVILK